MRLRFGWRAEEGGESGLGAPEFGDAFAGWLADHVDSHIAFLARVGNEAAGIAFLALIDRIPGPEVFVRRGGHVQSVYVTPAHRNAGVGEALMRAVIADAARRGLDYVMLHPTVRSRPFYRGLGFASHDGLMELRFRAGGPLGEEIPP